MKIRKCTLPDAPPCPFGHKFRWIGYDNKDKKYVRVTKSIFKKLINDLDIDLVDNPKSVFDNMK